MGFLDNVQEQINRGTDAVGRGTKTAQLKLRLNELVKERQKLAAQLGAGLYDKVKDDPAIREGLEQLFDAIAAIDNERASINKEIEDIEAASVASAAAAVTYKCPGCGANVSATDMFCSGCGKHIAEIKEAAQAAVSSTASSAPLVYDGSTCAKCGAPLGEGDVFCMSCGTPVATSASTAAVQSGPSPEAAVLDAIESVTEYPREATEDSIQNSPE